MDFSESTKVVYNRIQKLEPEHVSKIIGYLLLQDHGEREMIRLAFSPDNVLLSLINRAKYELRLSRQPVNPPISPGPVNPASPWGVSCATTLRAPGPYSDPRPTVNVDQQLLTLEDQLQLELVNCVNPEFIFLKRNMGSTTSRSSPISPDFPVKICHYFNRGFCKHGNSCRYFHSQPIPDVFSLNLNELGNEEHVMSPGSLEKLEFEIIELLKSRRGMPISIASLPLMYYEKYGKTLQADGYLTESQRHGKAGCSLTKLLARLKNSIRVIDRPHGQHSVILVDDVPKYLNHTSEGFVASSRQIYLTFPADSTFTEQDVTIYFSQFGPVQDVRIPCQQQRMFGFVSFILAETVKQILAKGNPHFVCGARVLVKPYREKSRKFIDKLHHPFYHNPYFINGESEFHSIPAFCNNSGLYENQFKDEHEQAIEFETTRLSELHLPPEHQNQQSHFDKDESEPKHISDTITKCYDHDSQGIDLPDSPFAPSSIGENSVSTVI